NISGDLTNVELNMITMPPGVRVPVEGTGFHDADEYSVFIDGEMYTESGNDKSIVKKGMATLIPKGEKHWCINKTDKPCTLLCMMVK
ncbi:MAG: cupin domain-containing protein, partial [Oscillospiraceae bacterium]